MFEGLRKKLSDAVKSFVKKEETKVEEQTFSQPQETIQDEPEQLNIQQEPKADTHSSAKKKELVQFYDSQFTTYLKTLKPEDWNVKVTSKWTVKDVVAHMIGWEKGDVTVIKDIWKTKEKPWWKSTKDYDDFNDKSVKYYKDDTPGQLVAEWESWQKKVREEVDNIGLENLMARPDLFDWLFEGTAELDGSNDSHYKHHYKQIKDAIEKSRKEAERQQVSVKRPQDHTNKKEEVIKLSLTTKIKGVFLGTIKLSETEIDGFLETLKVSMLESDVSYDTTEQFIDDLHSKLLERRIDSKKIKQEVTDTVRGSLFSVLQSTKEVNLDNFISSQKTAGNLPVKLLFLGPNGAGKTTTIAKMAHHFKQKGLTNVLAASDTFRAAAIEQIEHHAKKLGVTIIKSTYGADPASIAFDAIAYAKAHGADVVLIDSAGRQETNKSLMSEVQKMVRIAKPDLTIFVGESTSGNQIAEQIKEFNKFVNINGIILTKLDADAKGGGALSISHTTGIPILFFGVGEGYDALMPYNPSYIVDAILPEGG